MSFSDPWDALEKPFEFRVDALNATLTLGFDRVTFNYTLKVDATPFEDLLKHNE